MRQRHTAQMKDQIETPEKELNEMEISSLLEAEFKTLFIRMLKKLSEHLSTIESKKQTKQTGTETKSWIWRMF